MCDGFLCMDRALLKTKFSRDGKEIATTDIAGCASQRSEQCTLSARLPQDTGVYTLAVSSRRNPAAGHRSRRRLDLPLGPYSEGHVPAADGGQVRARGPRQRQPGQGRVADSCATPVPARPR